MPVVSVILNSYNQGKYLRESVESVLAQTFADFELIIVDNGSTDGSPDILRSFSDERIRLFLHKENVSITRRFNEAVAAVGGEFISFLYSDDFYLPNKLARQVELFRSLPSEYGLVNSPGLGLNERTQQRWVHSTLSDSGFVLEKLFTNFFDGFLNMISPMTKREALLRYPFYEDVFAEGEGIYFRVAMKYHFHFDKEPLAVVRDHGANRGKAVKANHEMTMVMLERLAVHPDFPVRLRPLVQRLCASLSRTAGWSMLRQNGDGAWARARLKRVVTLAPREALNARYVSAVGLSMIPAPMRRIVNRLFDKLLPVPGNRGLVDGYHS